MKRHVASKYLSTTLVTIIDECTWQVKSADKQQQYTVVKELPICTQNCCLRCNDSDICVHMYYCNCMDAIIRNTLCKHIHLVVRFNKPALSTHTKPELNTQSIQTGHKLILQTTDNRTRQTDIDTIKSRILEQLCSLTAQVKQCTNIQGLLAAQKNNLEWLKCLAS